MGYVLPWGQMSFWGRHRDHHQPVSRPSRWSASRSSTGCWGGGFARSPTRPSIAFYYALPTTSRPVQSSSAWFGLHVVALHVHGSNNPMGIDPKGPQDTRGRFHP